MQENQLKPCPFCGCKIVLLEKPKKTTFRISCSECRASMEEKYKRNATTEEVEFMVLNLTQNWNMRFPLNARSFKEEQNEVPDLSMLMSSVS